MRVSYYHTVVSLLKRKFCCPESSIESMLLQFIKRLVRAKGVFVDWGTVMDIQSWFMILIEKWRFLVSSSLL